MSISPVSVLIVIKDQLCSRELLVGVVLISVFPAESDYVHKQYRISVPMLHFTQNVSSFQSYPDQEQSPEWHKCKQREIQTWCWHNASTEKKNTPTHLYHNILSNYHHYNCFCNVRSDAQLQACFMWSNSSFYFFFTFLVPLLINIAN